jgi:hypothetical protein
MNIDMGIDPAEIYADGSERLNEIFLKTYDTLQKSFRGYGGVISLKNLFGGVWFPVEIRLEG